MPSTQIPTPARAPAIPTASLPGALHFDGQRTSIVHRAPPQLAAGCVILRPVRVLLSSIDRRIFARQLPFTGILGRDVLAIVEQIGPNVPPSLVGQRVVCDAFIPCNTCDLCRGGLSHLCESRTVPGASGLDGFAAPLATVPARSLVPVPRGISDDHALFAQSIAAAIHATNFALRDARDPAAFVTVLGDGLIALLAARIAASRHGQVRLVGKHPERFTRCERWGIKHRHIVEAGKRNDQAIVIDCTGDASADGFATAVALVRPRGRIITKGLPFAPPPTSALTFQHTTALATAAANEVSILGAGSGHVREGINFMSAHRLDVSGLISRSFTLAQADDALTSLGDRRVLACELSLL